MVSMSAHSAHVSIFIDSPPSVVYAYASDPSQLPNWAAGLVGSVEQVDGRWVSDSPMGRITIQFAPPNDYGVLDHDVTLPDGQVVNNPMRVLRHGHGSEVVFGVRRQPEMSDEDFQRDQDAVAADLAALKRLFEHD